METVSNIIAGLTVGCTLGIVTGASMAVALIPILYVLQYFGVV